MHSIFPLKNSNPIYAVQFLITFCHFINSNMAKFYDQMPSLMPFQYGDRAQYFNRGTISRQLPTKIKEQYICTRDGDCISSGIKLVFQEVFGVIKTQILFNPLVIIKWDSLLEDLYEQNGVHRFTDPLSVTSLSTINVGFIWQNLYVMCRWFLRKRERVKTGQFQVYKRYTKMYFHEYDTAKHLEIVKHHFFLLKSIFVHPKNNPLAKPKKKLFCCKKQGTFFNQIPPLIYFCPKWLVQVFQ